MKEKEIINILELNSNLIRLEFNSLSEYLFQAWHETQIYTGEWITFAIYNHYRLVEPNCTLCPNTLNVLQFIPNVVNAGFSTLKANTYIKPHKGYTDEVLRYHLGIKVPSSGRYECGLIIYDDEDNNEEIIDLRTNYFKWENNKAFCFNDCKLHSAHNYTTEDRTVLIVDVLK